MWCWMNFDGVFFGFWWVGIKGMVKVGFDGMWIVEKEVGWSIWVILDWSK